MQTILVTGGAGFVGSRLVRKLVSAGHAVSLLVRSGTDLTRIKDLLPKAQRFIGDLTNRGDLEEIVKKAEPMGVFHLAVSNMQSGVAAPDKELIRANIVGMVNLCAALKNTNYRFFINTGSFLEYGLSSYPAKESSRCEPDELYSITKLAATLYGQMLARREKKPIVTFRLFSPYGPGMQRGRLIESIISRALRGEEIPMTNPKVTRDLIFADDIADLYLESMARAGEVSGEIFNAGTGLTTTLGDLVARVLQATGSKSLVRWNALPPVSYDQAVWRADMTKTFARFKWRPAHTLEQGLTETIRWFRESGTAR